MGSLDNDPALTYKRPLSEFKKGIITLKHTIIQLVCRLISMFLLNELSQIKPKTLEGKTSFKHVMIVSQKISESEN